MSWVCKHCGSDQIASIEETTVWAEIEIDEDGVVDWPSGIGGGVEWETIGFVCRGCWTDTEKDQSYEELFVKAPKEGHVEDTMYTVCGHHGCWHFVDNNPAADDGYTPYIHLDDGDKEHSHDAVLSAKTMTLEAWHQVRPELFWEFEDGKIGPNSTSFRLKGSL